MRLIAGLFLLMFAFVLLLVGFAWGYFNWSDVTLAMDGGGTADNRAYAWGRAIGAMLPAALLMGGGVYGAIAGVRLLRPRPARYRTTAGGEWMTGAFRIEPLEQGADGEGQLRYLIYRGSTQVARYWHDLHGDDHGIEFVAGPQEARPLGQVADFLDASAGQAPALTKRAIAYLDAKARQLHVAY